MADGSQRMGIPAAQPATIMDLTRIREEFRRLYGSEPRYFHAPGRVNLIGEHTDYNDGYVLPIAIRQGTLAAMHARADGRLRVRSMNLDETAAIDLAHPGAGRRGSWVDYVEGIAAALLDRGIPLAGADVLIQSEVPIGGGLSSSAALEMAMAAALLAACGRSLDPLSLALAGQRAEHLHVGIRCGIMDQFTSVHGMKNHALLLDCRALEAKPVPIRLDGVCIILCDSGVRHALASSEYNRRRQDCEHAVSVLRTRIPGIRALRDVTYAQLQEHRAALEERVFRRCRHVTLENERTLQAAAALEAGDAAAMGRLMRESHRSLKEDYEVSCRELDLLVESACRQPGVLGARMTGGGFGGCTVNLVRQADVCGFMEAVSRSYQAETGMAPKMLAAEAGDGAREIIPGEEA